MAGDADISSREASCRAALAKVGLALRQAGGGYQVVDASTQEAVAGQQGPDGYSMSLDEVEDYTVMRFWAKGRPDRTEQVKQVKEWSGWKPGSRRPGDA